MGVVPLVLGAGGSELAAVADSAPVAKAEHRSQKAPGQRWGAAGDQQHIVGKNKNTVVPASLRGRYPLRGQKVAPKPRENTVKIVGPPKKSTAAGDFNPSRSTELPAARTANQRVYRNQDGSETTEFSTTPINYRQGDGTWAKIDTTLRRGSGWSNSAGAVDVRFAGVADDEKLADIGLDAEHSIGFGLRGAEDVAGTAKGSTIRYQGVRPGVDLELEATGNGAKETLVLSSASAPTQYVFDLHLKGLTAALDAGNAVVLSDAQGRRRATIPAGFMVDAGTSTRAPAMSRGVRYRLIGTQAAPALEVTVDPAWLRAADRAFPVKVDPSVEGGNASSAMTVRGTSSSSGSQELLTGFQGGQNSAAYIKFDSLVNSLQYHTIFGAQLQITGYDAPSCKARPVTVHPVTGSWTAGTGYSYPGPAVDGSLGKATFAYGFIAQGKKSSACPAKNTLINLGTSGRNLVQRWVDGKQANNGLSLRAASGDENAWKRFAGSGTANAPRLYVTHSPHNAKYSFPSAKPVKPVLQDEAGKVKISVTNRGSENWTPARYYLAYRVYNSKGKEQGQYHSANLPGTLARGAKVTLEATISKLPAGTYIIDFTMVGPGGKVFTDEQVPPGRLVIGVYNVPPTLQEVYPDNGYEAGTLTPQLWAKAIDEDAATSTLQYSFQICEVVPSGQTAPACTTQAYTTRATWIVPAGVLSWSKTYKWKTLIKDSNGAVQDGGFLNLLTSVPQPGVTSKIGGSPQVSREQEFDPQVGNLTTAAIEAPVINAGPDLNVLRTYNSLDPRRDSGFGVGWSTRYDMKLTADNDGTDSVVIRYPDGQEVRFGKNPDGTYAAPTGRTALLTQDTSKNWKLTDRDKSVYTFAAGSGKLVRIGDSYGRGISITMDDTSGKFGRAQSTSSGSSASAKALTFTWAGGHVASVSTEKVNGAALTWNYTYDGDLLKKVCAPGGGCTTYDYSPGTHYRTAVLNDRPDAYYRLGEPDDAVATSEVTVNLGKDEGSYTGAALGQAGAIAGSPDTAVTLNGTSGSINLPKNAIKRNRDQAIELWFKTTTGGPLVGYQGKALGETSTTGAPVMYVGTDGKLRGQLATGTIAPITSTKVVNDGAWHHAVLSAMAATQTLYLDGAKVGTLAGTINHDKLSFNQAGAAYATTPASWPGWGSVARRFFNGSLDEVAQYARPLGSEAVTAHHKAGSVAADQLSRVTLPSGRIASETSYDLATDRVSEYTDRHGGTWKVGPPTVYGGASDLRRGVQVRDPADRPYFYEFDALAGRIIRSGMPTGLGIREEDTPSPPATTQPNPPACTKPDPTQPEFCTIVPGGETGPVYYTLDGLSVRSYEYDAAGNQNRIWDENGNHTSLTFDARGNSTSHTTCRAAGSPGAASADCHTDYSTYPATVTDAFSPNNDLAIETRDARSKDAKDTTYLTTYKYDFAGNMLEQQNPDGGKVTHAYTDGASPQDNGITPPGGLLRKTTDALNAVTTYAYLADGSLDTVVESTGLKTTYGYDVLGRKSSETQISDAHPAPGVTTTYGYDGMSRMTSMTEPVTTDAVTGVKHQRRTAYSYDGDGSVLSTQVSDLLGGDPLRETVFEYDDFGNVSKVVDAEKNETIYGYDQFGNRTSMVDALERRYEYGYTARNDLAESRLWDWKGDPDSAPSNGEYLVLHSYTFDLAGRILSDTDAMGRRLEYTYNHDNTLKDLILKDFHNPDGTTRDIVIESKTYDAAGNVVLAQAGNKSMTTKYTYTPTGQVETSIEDPGGINRQTKYTYDKAGNVTRSSLIGNESNLTWPSLDSNQVVEYVYDKNGQQKQQIQTSGSMSRITSTTYDQRGLATSVTDPLGNATDASDAEKAAHTTTFGYDELARRIRSTAPAVNAESNGAPAKSVNPVELSGYNTFDDVVSVKDALGNVSRATVDRLGRQTSQIGAAYIPPGSTAAITATSRTQYDAMGNVTQQTDPRGNETRYGYDRMDRLSSRSEPTKDNENRAVWHYAYTRTGEVLSVTDPKGGRVESTYDDLDRPISTTQVERAPKDNFTTRYGYDDAGNVKTITSPTGDLTTNTYDTIGQLIKTVDPAGVVTQHGYDVFGREVRLTDGLNRTSRTDFDGFGQVAEESDISANNTTLRSQTYQYDPNGNLIAAVSPLKTKRTYTYDALGRLTKQTEPVTATSSITTSFGYDAAGNRTRYTDGRGNDTITKVNSWGLAESVVEPSTTAHPAATDRTWTVAYDENANAVKLAAPGGVSRSRTFDASDRLTDESGAGTSAATVARSLEYDELGRLTEASAPGGANTFSYNDRGMMTKAEGPSGKAAFEYNGDGDLTSRTDAAGTATFGYADGRLKTQKDGIAAATQTFDYDAAGAVKSVDYGSGRMRTYGYDDFGRLASDTTKNSAKATVSSVTYGYDLDDRMTSKDTTGTAGAGKNTYDYDQAGRMTAWTSGNKTVDYAWDDSGNRTKEGAKTATYDARNRLMSDSDYTYSYSPSGAMTGRTSSGLTEPFSFDAFDRLVSQGSTTYTYDGLDRVANRAGANLKYAGVSDELVSDGTETYARGAYDELMAISQGTSKRTTLSDQHGDVFGAFETSNTGLTSLDDSTAYDPFGQVLASAGTKHNVGFQGDYTDPETDQVNMGSRWYNPGSGTFLSRDTAQYVTGASILANKYTYGAGAPMDYSDPDGNWPSMPSCSLCHKVVNKVGGALRAGGHALAAGAGFVKRHVQSFVSWGGSVFTSALGKLASLGRSLWAKGKAAVNWVGGKLASAGRWAAGKFSSFGKWAAGKAANARSWAREKAEAARRAAVARAKAITATAKRAVKAAIQHNPLPAIKAALKPLMSGVKTLVSAAASIPAGVVSVTKDVIADGAKATQAIYQKSLDKAGMVIDDISAASSVVSEFAAAAMPTVLGVAAGALTTGACLFATVGAGSAACIVAGFAVGGAVTSALSCAPGRSVAGCAARGGAAGAVAGAVTVATGGAGAVVSGGLGAAAGDAGLQYMETGEVDAGQVAMSAAGGAVGGKLASRGCNSFTPETGVRMADGSTKEIADVKVGDEVVATDPTTGKTSTQPVTEVIVGSGEKHLVLIKFDAHARGGKLGADTLTATDGHPFWVEGNGEQFNHQAKGQGGHWATAGELRPGDRLRTPKGGASVAVLDTNTQTEMRTVYNLTVDGVHTYYIEAGDTDVLVHNGSCKISGSSTPARKPLIIGENMKRVNAYAESNGGQVYRPWPNEPWDADLGMRRNTRMIRDAVKSGRDIVDIGPDFARRAAGREPSPFYNMERREVMGYENYSKVFDRAEGGVPGLDN
jgi:RHS repeat-associated protein